MRIKIFVPNARGKIELTKEELEQLLNESYNQGWADKPGGYYYSPYYYGITCTSNSASATALESNSTSVTALESNSDIHSTFTAACAMPGSSCQTEMKYKVEFENETAKRDN